MATRTIANGGGNWNNTATWVEGAFPIAGDAVVATGTSGQVTINVASACASIDLTNYTNTLTYNNTLTTTSTVNYPSGMTVAGTSDHITVTGSTITIACASGLTGGLRLGGTSQTYTLGSDWTIAGTLLLNGATGTTFSGAHNITCGTFSNTMSICALVMSGNITCTGTATFSGVTSCTFSGAKAFQTASATISGGLTVNITNIGSMTVTGLTTSSTTANVFTGGTWNTQGLTTSIATTGTTLFNLTGGGTITLTAVCSNSITIAGNTTWASATNLYAASGTPTLTYSSGTITVGTSILSIASSCTIVNGSGVTLLHDLSITAAATLTTNTNTLIMDGTLTLGNVAITLGGNVGITAANLLTATLTATRIHTFTFGNTYHFTTNITNVITGANSIRWTVKSSSAGNKVVLYLDGAGTQSVIYGDPTDIDSNLGQTIFTYGGTITTTNNWSNTLPVNTFSPPGVRMIKASTY